ncbi:GntR family transcriptional regulator [Acetobacter thailandicus]|uniref:GntR family transcriptional regulator n=1 Tax=Acetobacter thailandicus TaxID=1502842 RepID=A0ABT3QCL8_9PROT|nr:GntR family transcriptional regulator [Acetobacter thailandicus]MCX2563037.1 GntR family transcriptional regulator [Acetobacter thailandicus]NHN96339.1 FCD domain-containing protein [Acetobacter thailandicus]
MASELCKRLSAQILNYIADQKLEKGDHLSASVLTEFFRVSRAPIETALRDLTSQGFMSYEKNRGFFIKKDWHDLAQHEVSPSVTEGADDAFYLSIASDRLDDTLPEKITTNELIRRYNLTRPQIVRIMTQIVQEGWGVRLPGHGWQFLPVLTNGIAYDQAYRFRAAVESAALLEPGYFLPSDVLCKLRQEQEDLLDGNLNDLPIATLFAINAGFHESITGACGNPFFLDSLRRINNLRRLLEYRVTVVRDRFERQCKEHIELLNIIEDGDFVTASAFLRIHIGGARRLKGGILA